MNYDKPDIVLIGYYGKGNFGDDVLLKVSFELIKSYFPNCTIGIRLETEDSYVFELLDGVPTFVPFGSRTHHKLIVHGGGGNFFDFKATHGFRGILNHTILNWLKPRNYARLNRFIRKLVGKRAMTAGNRVGIGMGIGTYTFTSARLSADLPILDMMTSLWVRDSDSIANVQRLKLDITPLLGSDLAFLHEYWLDRVLVKQRTSASKRAIRVGLVLRDWPVATGDVLPNRVKPVVDALSAKYDTTLVSFDAQTDACVTSSFPAMDLLQWSPATQTIQDFAVQLSHFDVLVTARAHGAICGACLGLPSVILGIEPKLHQVSRMLSGSSELVEDFLNPNAVCAAVERLPSASDVSTVADVERNRLASANIAAKVFDQVEMP